MGKLWDKIRGIRDKRRPFCTAVIAAAGRSERMNGENKLLLNLCGAPVLMRTLCAVDQTALVDEIIVAAREDMMLEVADLCSRSGLQKPVRVVRGGDTRAASVLAAVLEADSRTELIAVHDGARPLIRPEEFDELIRQGGATYAVAPAVPLSDTVKAADETGRVTGTPDRRTLFAIRTPQVFQADILKAALKSALEAGVELTDDCAAVERLGKEVYLTPGDPENIKITTPLDVIIAEAILRQRGLGQ
ncbi:MAG: 2-C-methyl-D-erythritol 4-phosphate cytidylyltransferase [Ruminococcaceae bacterium]|jgi:2-C-methyl-D-erythritol 4-phosphate cytidylyltransferase|nr:2-C-methyl-D-erythritol 4-phosphate cytidylyltransferase [Oscillospiraceae bacterium]